ncbi:MAG: hypothetical protein Kow0090_23080 [Myxococcota bacterium]
MMNNAVLKLGPLAIKAPKGVELPDGYKPFCINADKSDVSLTLKYEKSKPRRGKPKIAFADAVWRYFDNNGGWRIEVTGGGKVWLSSAEYDKNRKQLNISINDGYKESSPFSYPLFDLVCRLLLIEKRAFILHSALLRPSPASSALALLGPSGAGKSTLSELAFAAGWNILCDDKVIISNDNGRLFAHSAPWTGSFKKFEPASAPLAAFVALKKSNLNKLEEIAGVELFSEIMRAFFPPFQSKREIELLMDAIENALASTPAYRLHFARGKEALKELECIFKRR